MFLGEKVFKKKAQLELFFTGYGRGSLTMGEKIVQGLYKVLDNYLLSRQNPS